MRKRGIILFGKHPAWSDHMFVSGDVDSASSLKSVFYDKSVITALQAVEESDRCLEDRCFIVWCEEKVYWLVSVPSSDSVGRKRFPIFAAIELDWISGRAVSFETLDSYRQQMLRFIHQQLDLEGTTATTQIRVQTAAAEFYADAGLGDAITEDPAIDAIQLRALMTKLSEGTRAFMIEDQSFEQSCLIVEAGRKQFAKQISAVVIFDAAIRAEVVIFAENNGSLKIGKWLEGKVNGLAIEPERVKPSVQKLLPKHEDSLEYSLDRVPSLRMNASSTDDENKGTNLGSKQIIAVLVSLLFVSIIVGILLGGGDEEGELIKRKPVEAVSVEAGPHRVEWTQNAEAYVSWVSSLQSYFRSNQNLPPNSALRILLEKELNPFAVVTDGVIRPDLINNPLKRTFLPESQAALAKIYKRVDKLKHLIRLYFESDLGGEDFVWLSNQGYIVPSFLQANETEALWYEPSFSSDLVGQLEFALAVGPDLKRIRVLASEAEAFLDSIPSLAVDTNEAIQAQMYHVLEGISDSAELKEAALKLEGWVSVFVAVKNDGLAVDLMLESSRWQQLMQQEPSDEHLAVTFSLLSDFRLVPDEQFEDLVSRLDQIRERVRNALSELRADFPEAASDAAAIENDLAVKRLELSVMRVEPITRITLSKAQELVASLSAEWLSLAIELEGRYGQLSDPSTWLVRYEDEIQSFSSPQIQELAQRELELLKKRLTSESQAPNLAYTQFKNGAADIIESLRQIDLSGSLLQVQAVQEYLKDGDSAARLSIESFVLSRLNNHLLTLEGANRLHEAAMKTEQELSRSLSQLNQNRIEANTRFMSLSLDASAAADLHSLLRAIVGSPFRCNQIWAYRFELFAAGIEGHTIDLKSKEDLFWYLKTAYENKSVTVAVLSVATEFWNSFDEKPAILKTIFIKSFETFGMNLAENDPMRLIAIYANLEAFIPLSLQTEGDSAVKQIVTFYGENSDHNFKEIQESGDVSRAQESATHPLAKSFFIKIREGIQGEGAGQAALQQIVNDSPLLISFEQSDTFDAIKLTLANDDELRFLPVASPSGKIYVQQVPLSLSQFLSLLSDAGMDVLDRLARMESYWPRSFVSDVSGSNFTTLNGWEFFAQEPKKFDALPVFTKQTIPAHIIEPRDAKALADAMGLRLFLPDEVQPFLATTANLVRKPINLSSAQISQLEEAGTLKQSIYQSQILKSRDAGTWAGGLDFETNLVVSNEFVEVFGGSAELAFDERGFFVFGGSWLYLADPSTLVPVPDPRETYLDVGIRFVFDAPAPSLEEISFDALCSAFKARFSNGLTSY